MQIIMLMAPRNGGTVYCGLASNAAGLRYTFTADMGGDTIEAMRQMALNSRFYEAMVSIPPALRVAIRRAVIQDTRKQKAEA